MKCKRKKADFGISAGTAALIGAIVSAIGAGTTAAVNIKNAKNQAANAQLQQRYETMSENDKRNSLFTNNLQSFYNNQDAVDERKNSLTLPTLNNSQFRCGGSRYYKRPKSLLGTQDDELNLQPIDSTKIKYENHSLPFKKKLKYRADSITMNTEGSDYPTHIFRNLNNNQYYIRQNNKNKTYSPDINYTHYKDRWYLFPFERTIRPLDSVQVEKLNRLFERGKQNK